LPSTVKDQAKLAAGGYGHRKRRSLKKPRKCFDFRLRSVAVVIMNDSTENGTTAHQSIALATRFWDRNLLFEALMRACRVEELDVIAHDTSQVRLVDDQQLIQAFFAHRSNPVG
jgi:hypothetical protein